MKCHHFSLQNTAIPLGPPTPDEYDEQMSFVTDVVFDQPPMGKKFGDVIQQPPANATKGDTISVKFVSMNNTNLLRNTHL